MTTSELPTAHLPAILEECRWLMDQVEVLGGAVHDFSSPPPDADWPGWWKLLLTPEDYQELSDLADSPEAFEGIAKLRVDFRHHWRWVCKDAWDHLHGCLTRLNVLLNYGDLRWLQCTPQLRAVLQRIWDVVQKLNAPKPDNARQSIDVFGSATSATPLGRLFADAVDDLQALIPAARPEPETRPL